MGPVGGDCASRCALGCVGACTKGLSVAAALRRKKNTNPCRALEREGRRADGPVRRCSGRAAACSRTEPAAATPRMCALRAGSFLPVRVFVLVARTPRAGPRADELLEL